MNSATLLLHDGELADVRALLEELGARFEERSGGAAAEVRQARWDLVIATPKRMLEFAYRAGANPPTRIAILAGEARVLRKMMQREKIEFVVRRPVHPAALRLLIVHALYGGHEKREVSRVAIGAQVHFRTGWLWRRAILLDLSIRGCRLEARQRLARGDRISIRLPGRIAGRRSLWLTGRVLRHRPVDESHRSVEVVAVRFDAKAYDVARLLQTAVNGYASGPASLHRSIAKRFAVAERDHDTSPADDARLDADTAEPALARASGKPRGVRADRRGFSRRVIAMGEEFTGVLIGRDLSAGGMRVDPNPELLPGDFLRIALHSKAGELPLVVQAEVCRDDGEEGLALQFRDLSSEAKSYLRGMLESLPAIEAPSRGRADAAGVFVSEILDPEGI